MKTTRIFAAPLFVILFLPALIGCASTKKGSLLYKHAHAGHTKSKLRYKI